MVVRDRRASNQVGNEDDRPVDERLRTLQSRDPVVGEGHRHDPPHDPGREPFGRRRSPDLPEPIDRGRRGDHAGGPDDREQTRSQGSQLREDLVQPHSENEGQRRCGDSSVA
jgi:hypothetical protein